MRKGGAAVENHSIFNKNINTHCGVVTIVGYPNSGKSTLMNALVGYKVSIVTHKVQTTRRQIQGVLTKGDSQVVFIDTPGIFDAKKPLEKALVTAAYKSFQGVDKVILLMDVREYDPEFVSKIQKLAGDIPFQLVINKIDKVTEDVYKDIPGIKISAKTGEGVESLKQDILTHLPPHPFLYDPDQLTNINQKIWTAEMTREKAMLALHQELPYELYVETESFKETKTYYEIKQVIVVSRDGLKGMVLGSTGSMIKKIGTESRLEMESLLGRKVNLFLYVKVQPDWQEKRMVLQSLGIAQ